MSDARHELSMQLATGFAAICLDYLPVMEEAVRRSSTKTSFGVRVEVWKDFKAQAIRGRLTSNPPKIAAEARKSVDFLLQMNSGGQLEFIFEGTPGEFKKAIAAGEDDE